MACNRCLKPVQQAVESTIDLVLVERSRKREATEEEQLEAQELGLVEVEGGSFREPARWSSSRWSSACR